MTGARYFNASVNSAISVAGFFCWLVVCAPGPLAADGDRYTGRLLADVLRELQQEGVRVVFSSAHVTPEMRVKVEPRSKAVRQMLDELLTAHGLATRDGPAGTIQVVRAASPAPSETTSPGAIEGRVVDASNGGRLSGVIVSLDGPKRQTRTDIAGRFRFRRVAAGSRTLVVSAAGYVSVTQAIEVSEGRTSTIVLSASPATKGYAEYVSVDGPIPKGEDRGVASQTILPREHFDRTYGALDEDPTRAVHLLPGVAPIDDFRSEFSVRGSPYRHVDLVIDGVATEWLQHTAYRRGPTGSLPMLSGQLLENGTLSTGAYPRRHGNRLGPQLDLSIREGSRQRVALRGAIGFMTALVVGEGPLHNGRGSWLVALRRSHAEWPIEHAESTRTAFGFGDGLIKAVYDVGPRQQFAIAVLGGRSTIDVDEESPTNDLERGVNRAGVVNVSWRSMFGDGGILRQRVYFVRQHFMNTHVSGRHTDGGGNHETGYRADVTRPIGSGVFEGGVQIKRTTVHDRVTGRAWTRAAYLHYAWAPVPTLTFSPGVRVAHSTLSSQVGVSRWFLSEWAFLRNWTVTGSTGASYQLPEPPYVLGEFRSRPLRPEAATYFDVGIEQRLASSVRWQATIFSRNEDHIFREPELYPRLVNDVMVLPDRGMYANQLQGDFRGIELLLDRSRTIGLTGWAAYSFGKAEYTDFERGERYAGNFDQRHALSIFGTYRFANGAGIGASFRASSNFPIPAYLAARSGRLFVAERRNRVRLPYYSRLDVRADREFRWFGQRLKLYGELLNALNRANVGLAGGSIDSVTGEATGFTDTLFRRAASAGLVVDF